MVLLTNVVKAVLAGEQSVALEGNLSLKFYMVPDFIQVALWNSEVYQVEIRAVKTA